MVFANTDPSFLDLLVFMTNAIIEERDEKWNAYMCKGETFSRVLYKSGQGYREKDRVWVKSEDIYLHILKNIEANVNAVV